MTPAMWEPARDCSRRLFYYLDDCCCANTGRVALTTGHVSFKDTVPVAGLPERDIVLDTSTGTIVVGPQGLTGALIGLDLIAKNLLINGPLTNTFTSQTAAIRAVAGHSN